MIAHVVYRENYRETLNRRVFPVLGSQQHRNQGGLPVMAVDHLGRPDVLGKLDGRAAELREPLGVIRIILSRHAVELIAVEVLRVLDKVVAHAAQDHAVQDRWETQRVAHRDAQARRGHRPDFRTAVPRKQHRDFMPERDKRPGQRFHHVRKASRFRKREPFGGDKEYFHIPPFKGSTVLNASAAVKDHAL